MASRFLALALASALTGCLTADPVEDFRAARSEGTPEAYETFLARHSRNPLSRVALKELTELRERRDWLAAEQGASPESYRRFIGAHPTSYFAAKARERRDALIEREDWQRAREADRADAYSTFIRKYPLSKFNSEAGERLENIGSWEPAERAVAIAHRSSRETGAVILPAFAFVPIHGAPFAIVKDGEQRYWKLSGNPAAAADAYLSGVDAPALSVSPPLSGLVFYMNWDTIASARFDGVIQQLLAQVVQQFRDAAVETRILLIPAPDAPPRQFSDRAIAATWFGSARSFSLDLADGNPAVRTRAAQALGLMREIESAPALASAWGDPEPDVRNAAAVALLRLGSEHATRLLRGAAALDVEPLVVALGDWDPQVSAAAGHLLVSIGPAAVPALIAELDRPLSRGASQIARTLGEIGDPRAIDALSRHLDDAPHTRDAAEKALAGIDAN